MSNTAYLCKLLGGGGGHVPPPYSYGPESGYSNYLWVWSPNRHSSKTLWPYLQAGPYLA